MDIAEEINSTIYHINKFYSRLLLTPGHDPRELGTVLEFYNGSKRGNYIESVKLNGTYNYRMAHPIAYFSRTNALSSELCDVEFLTDKMRLIWFPDTSFVSLAIKSSDAKLLRDNLDVAQFFANTLGLMCYTVYDEKQKTKSDRFNSVRIRSICSFGSENTINEEQVYHIMKRFGDHSFRGSRSSVYFCMTEGWPKQEMFENPLFHFPVRGIWQMHDIVHSPAEDKSIKPEQLSIVVDQLKLSFSSILSWKNGGFAWCILTWDIITKEKGQQPGFYYTVVDKEDQSKNQYEHLHHGDRDWDWFSDIRSLVMLLHTTRPSPTLYDVWGDW